MIFNRAQMTLETIVDDDGTVVLCGDGTAAGSNKKSFVIVEGVPSEITEKVPLDQGRPLGVDALKVSRESIKTILRDVPRDKKFGGLLEHVDFVADELGEAEAKTTDGKRTKRVRMRGVVGQTAAVHSIAREALACIQGAERTVCLNRDRLASLLDAFDKAAEDSSGESPVWLSFSNDGDVVLRGVNFKTGQRILGVMRAYKDDAAAVPALSAWEAGIMSGAATGLKPARMMRRRAV